MAIQIETTQNVVIEQEPAGLGLRTAAFIIDYLIFAAWYIIIFVTLIFLIKDIDGDAVGLIFLVLVGIPYMFYDLLMEYFNNGQTLAKMLFGIRVVNLDGTKPSFTAYLLRWLFRPVDFLISNGMLALIMVLTTKNSQRLGDFLAGTTVINTRAIKEDKDISIQNITFPDNYEVTYHDILERLSDKDIRTIRIVLKDPSKFNGYTVGKISQQVKFMTGYEYEGTNDLLFLKKILDDYDYQSVQFA